jgi:hypothetical protein
MIKSAKNPTIKYFDTILYDVLKYNSLILFPTEESGIWEPITLKELMPDESTIFEELLDNFSQTINDFVTDYMEMVKSNNDFKNFPQATLIDNYAKYLFSDLYRYLRVQPGFKNVKVEYRGFDKKYCYEKTREVK